MLKLVVAALTGLALATPTMATASPPRPRRLGELEGRAWSMMLAVPRDQHPPANGCLKLGDDIVGPVNDNVTCVVNPGTKIFVFGYEVECDNAEPPPFYGATLADQVACARASISSSTAKFTVDGTAIHTVDATSPPESITLPENNIDQVPAGPITFAVNGLVGLSHPLPPGTHTFKSHFEFAQPSGPPQSGGESFRVKVLPASRQ